MVYRFCPEAAERFWGDCMKNIYIKTEHGHMTIYADQFFPCTQKQFRKLLSVIKEFSYLNNVKEIAEQLKTVITHKKQSMDSVHWTKKRNREISALKKCLEMLEQVG